MFGLAAPGSAIPVDSTAIKTKVVTQNQPDAATKARVLQAYDKLPLSFEANQGQTDKQVKFLARGSGYTVFLTSTEAVLTLSPAYIQPSKLSRQSKATEPIAKTDTTVLRLQLVGSNPTAQVLGKQQLPGKSNYLTGNGSKWHTNIAHYAQVQYQAVYPGIDLVDYGNQGQLEYDFIVAPGANPKNIRFQVKGASRLSIDQQGNLLLHTPKGIVRQHRPRIYQQINGQKQTVAGGYVLLGKQQVGFKVAAYNHSQRLVIDPVLSYSTYLGAGGSIDSSDFGRGIAVDLKGNIYVVGQTSSPDFPTKNAFDSTYPSQNPGNVVAFVTKLNPNASGADSLVYSTYLGGSGGEGMTSGGGDHSEGIAVDLQGNAYVTGTTISTDFPTTENAFARTLGGLSDAFVTELNATGDRLLYSTYLGGSGADSGNAIAQDNRGNVYVTGATASSNFPTINAFDSNFKGNSTTFVTKLNLAASGSNSLVYSTYLGGSGGDAGSGIAVDLRGNAYVTGRTGSTNFPIKNGFQTTLRGSFPTLSDAFVTKLNPSASGEASLVYSTYLGGSGDDAGSAIAVDLRGNAYVTGGTGSTDFPTKNAFISTFKGNEDAFVTKVNPSASGEASLVYSTYLGGSYTNQIFAGYDYGTGIAVDLQGNAYVTGFTNSLNFPTKDAFQSNLGGRSSSFVTKLNPTGIRLVYSTYLGGNGEGTYSTGIAVDLRGNTYVTGYTLSTDFPTLNGFQNTLRNTSGIVTTGFVTKFSR